MEILAHVHILDVNGNAKGRFRAPDADEDRNVFDISQGGASCLLVRRTEEGNWR